MSTQTEKLPVSTSTEPNLVQESVDALQEQTGQEKTKLRARLAEVLTRSIVEDRLNVKGLPDDIHGEWVPNNELEIHRKLALGFKVDDKYAVNNSLHSDSPGNKPTIGDVIFMTCDKSRKELLDDIEQERQEDIQNPKRPKEIKDYEKDVRATTNERIPITNASKQEKTNLTAVLDSLPKQVTVR